VYWGIAIILLSVIGGIVLGMVFAAAGGTLALFIPAALIGLGVIAGTITGLTGRIFCLDVPEETNARSLIYAAVICDAVAILVSIATWIPNVPESISSITNLLSLLATLLFIIFLKRIAKFIGRSELADRAQSILTLGIVLVALSFGTALLLFVVGPLAGLLGFVVVVLGLVVFLRYVRLVLDLRKAILEPTP